MNMRNRMKNLPYTHANLVAAQEAEDAAQRVSQAPMLSDLVRILEERIIARRKECEALYADLPYPDESDSPEVKYLNNRGKGLQFFHDARRSLQEYIRMWGDRAALPSEMMWM